MSVIRDDSAGQGAQDRHRYQDKIRDRLKKVLPDLVGGVPIITGDGHDVISVPVDDRDITVPRYRPARPEDPAPGVGQGPGQPGDVVAKIPKAQGGQGSQPGSEAAEHPVFVDLTLDELRQLVVDDLQLPPLPPKVSALMPEMATRWISRAQHGTLSQVDRRATIRQALLRSQAQHRPLAITPDDLRYRTWVDKPAPVTQAVIALIRDASGSMDTDRRYLSQMAAWRLVASIRQQYPICPVHFWIHDIAPTETDEMTFYRKENGGGTAFAPTYAAVRDLLDTHYPEATWNRVILQFSDGDLGDPTAAHALLADWLPTLHFFGMILTQPSVYQLTKTMMRQWAEEFGPPFALVTIQRRPDVADALRRLMRGGEEVAG